MLTDTKLRNLKPKDKLYKINDRDGLYVAITPAGTISFRHNYSISGRQETLTIGRYGTGGITLAEARERLNEAKKMIAAGKSKYPIFPIKLLLKDKYESDKKIKNIISPILVMHGEADKIVPFYMGEKIYSLANEKKSKYFTENDDHMMEFDVKLNEAIKDFLKSLG